VGVLTVGKAICRLEREEGQHKGTSKAKDEKKAASTEQIPPPSIKEKASQKASILDILDMKQKERAKTACIAHHLSIIQSAIRHYSPLLQQQQQQQCPQGCI